MTNLSTAIKTILITLLFSFSTFINAEALSPLTPQQAEYKVFYGSIELGKARYKLEKNNNQYTYTFESALALLVLSDNREVSSEFTVRNNTVIPRRYFHDRRGTGLDYQEQLAFLDQQKKIFSRYKGEKQEFDYDQPLYDSLTIQLQLRLDVANHKSELKYYGIKGNEKDDYEFKNEGEEQIEINGKTYKTVKLEVIRENKKRQTFIWLAPELAYLPVKLSHFKRGRKQLAVYIDSYSFITEKQFTKPK